MMKRISGGFTKTRAGETGSAFMVTIVTITILALAAAHVCRIVSGRYRSFYQDASWQEALCGAEAGAEIAVVAMNSTNWSAWAGPDSNGVRTYTMPALTHAGEGTTAVTASVQVDSPPSFSSGTLGTYYRIRSTGSCQLVGQNYTGFDKFDGILRHLSLVWDRDTGAKVSGGPKVNRTIEIVTRPSGLFKRALTLTNSVSSNNSSSYIDSYDSTNSTKSTNGAYDPAKRQSHANLSSNDSTGSDLKGMFVYGDLAYTGATIPNAQNVQGTVTVPFSQTVLPVAKPTWSSVTANLGNITTNQSWQAGAAGSPTRYKISALNLASGATINITKAPSAAESEMEIWITGDMSTSGTGQIIAAASVKVTIYVEGQVSVGGKSVVNQSKDATYMNILGVTPAASDLTARTLAVSGSADFIGVVNAPAYAISLNGGGEFYGAFVAKTLSFKGSNTALHYDEALTDYGGGAEYKVASWTEDVR